MSLPDGPILFDFDGTLVDSSRGIIESLQYVMPNYGVTRTAEEYLIEIGPPFQVTWAKYGLSPEQITTCLAEYRAYYGAGPMFDVDVYDGIVDLLDALKATGRPLGVATAKAEPYVIKVIEHLGWLDYFDVISGSEVDGTRIHKVDIIAEALQRLDASGGVMVGDREPDLTGGQANGMAAVGITWGFAGPGELEACDPAALIDHPKELLPLL